MGWFLSEGLFSERSSDYNFSKNFFSFLFFPFSSSLFVFCFCFFNKGRGKKRNEIQEMRLPWRECRGQGSSVNSRGCLGSSWSGCILLPFPECLTLTTQIRSCPTKVGILVQKWKPRGFGSFDLFFNYFWNIIYFLLL